MCPMPRSPRSNLLLFFLVFFCLFLFPSRSHTRLHASRCRRRASTSGVPRAMEAARSRLTSAPRSAAAAERKQTTQATRLRCHSNAAHAQRAVGVRSSAKNRSPRAEEVGETGETSVVAVAWRPALWGVPAVVGGQEKRSGQLWFNSG